MGQGEHLLDGGDVLGVNAQTVHAGVNLDVDVDILAISRKLPRVGGFCHRLRQTVAREAREALRRGPAEYQYFAPYTGAPELHALCGAGDGEGPDAHGAHEPRRFDQAVAVGLAFEDGHELTANGQEGAEVLCIVPERGGVHLDPGAGRVRGARGPQPRPDEQQHRRCRRGTGADGQIVAQAVLDKQTPEPQLPRRPAHEHDDPGVQHVD